MSKVEDTLQSPKQIADHLRVTYVPTYLLAAAAIVLLAAFIVWSFLGNVSDKAYYSGVVFPVQGTTDITLPNKGIVRTMLVHNGDSVRQGQTVAIVSIGDSHSFLTSTVNGLVISTKADNEPFEAFDPIVSVVDGNAASQQSQHTQLIAYADNEVRIDLLRSPEDATHYDWSFGEPADVSMGIGTYCSVLTETKRCSMFQYLFESARTRFRDLKLKFE